MPFKSLGFRAKHVTPSSCGKAAINGLAKILHAGVYVSPLLLPSAFDSAFFTSALEHRKNRLPTCQASQH